MGSAVADMTARNEEGDSRSFIDMRVADLNFEYD